MDYKQELLLLERKMIKMEIEATNLAARFTELPESYHGHHLLRTNRLASVAHALRLNHQSVRSELEPVPQRAAHLRPP